VVRRYIVNVVKLSSKYQVVIPPEVREAKGWKPGDEIAVVEDDDGSIRLVRVPTFQELRGIFTGRITVPFERDKEYE
jgi:AbrB family looped-hinge helix DNA binding protein